MSNTIDQFMWGFQQTFRWFIECETKRVLDELGMPVTDTAVILVGIATEESAQRTICVEPGTGPLSSEHLAQVTSRAKELYQLDPESESFHTDPRAHEGLHRRLFLSARANAITEAIEKAEVFANLTFFVSLSSPVNGYDVHTCIGIPTDVMENLPAFKVSTVDRIHAGKSLQHEVIRECLYRADRALYLPDPGGNFDRVLGRVDDIITSATEGFLSGTIWRVAHTPSDICSALNEIASLTYERAGARGNLTITSHENLEKWLTVVFKNPVHIRESRAMRKVLQLSDGTMSVLADPTSAYGLGTSRTAPDVVQVSITGHARWEASVNGDKFVRVAYGKATIPNQPIEFAELEDIAERIIGDANTKLIWEIIQAAQENGQGTTLVVSADPQAEATRLSSEGMVIEPDYLKPEEVVRLGSVDGAVIIGPDGRCYAFGIILDGVVNEGGDRSRGARFNSAVRYQNMATAGSMIIVISDDGTIDLLPRLMPRVHRREEVAEAVDAFCECCHTTPIDGEEFGRLYDKVKRLAFYLNDEQCHRVNEKHEQEMDRRFESGGIKITGRNLQPDPRMNESYFWDSQSNLV